MQCKSKIKLLSLLCFSYYYPILRSHISEVTFTFIHLIVSVCAVSAVTVLTCFLKLDTPNTRLLLSQMQHRHFVQFSLPVLHPPQLRQPLLLLSLWRLQELYLQAQRRFQLSAQHLLSYHWSNGYPCNTRTTATIPIITKLFIPKSPYTLVLFDTIIIQHIVVCFNILFKLLSVFCKYINDIYDNCDIFTSCRIIASFVVFCKLIPLNDFIPLEHISNISLTIISCSCPCT